MLKGDRLPQQEFNYNKQCLILQGVKNAFPVIQPLQTWLLAAQ